MALSSVLLISVNSGAVRSHLCICPAILISYIIFVSRPMKHVVKILSLLVAVSAVWINLLQAAIIPRTHTWLLPLYFVVSLGCYGLLMVGIGLMQFPTCPQEAILLQHDITEAKDFLSAKGIDFGPE